MDSFYDWTTHLAAFVAGALTMMAGGYLADKFTDQRRDQESTTAARKAFRKVSSDMPEMIAEIRTDLSHPDNQHAREIVVLGTNRDMFPSNEKRIRLHETDHPNLVNKMKVLENHGYVVELHTSNVPIYRMSEQFVSLLKA